MLRVVAGEEGNAPQLAANMASVWSTPVPQLEVVAHREHDAGDDEHDETQTDTRGADDAEHDRAGDAGDRRGEERPRGDAGAQRPAVQLVEGVGGDADREEEGEHRRQQVHHVDRSEAPPDHDVREVPERCTAGGAASTSPAPSGPHAGLGIEGRREGRLDRGRRGRSRRPPSPHHEAAAEAHGSGADVDEPGLLPRLDGPRHRVALVVRGDARAEEASDVEPRSTARVRPATGRTSRV